LEGQNALPPLRRPLVLADALKREDWAAADRQIARMEQEQLFAMILPILRAWTVFGSRRADPIAALAPMESASGAGYGVEHRALIELAQGRGSPEIFASLDPGAGLRLQRLRLAAAAEFAARRQRDQALGLVAGDQPAFAAARRLIEAGRPIPGRIDSAADGVAELFARVAIDFNQQELSSEAVILAQIARYLAPDNSEATFLAAEVMGEERAAEAVRLLAQVPADDPFADAAASLRLRLLASSGQRATAMTEVRQRIARGSRDPADHIQLGDLLVDARQFDEAAAAYARAHELWRAGTYPAIPEWTLFVARGGALEQGGRWPEARTALREAYRLAPAEPVVLNYLGYAQIDRGEEPAESERMIREALRLAPDSAAITDSLGWALFRTGRVDEAIPYLERAARNEPADVEINEHLGDAYYAAGRRYEARFAWTAALVYAEGEAAERLRAKIERGPPRLVQR
ncbi:MAG TPA: tetratricopeptide repeat protein, partial [Allosphingosinicella sp.]